MFFFPFLSPLQVLSTALWRQSRHITNCTYLKYTVWYVWTNVYICRMITVVRRRDVSVTQKLPRAPWVIHTSSLLLPSSGSNRLAVCHCLHFPKSYVNGIIQCITLFKNTLLLSILILQFMLWHVSVLCFLW